MQEIQFEYVRQLLKQNTGLVLTKDKVYLLESRLAPVARNHGLKSVDELVTKLKVNKDSALANEITEAMASTESSFFRDRTPFLLLKKALVPELAQNRQPEERIRIWCAGASTGQEPYSIAMLLQEEGEDKSQNGVDILATDISEKALKRSSEGRYTHFEVQRGLPIQMLVKHFDRDENEWILKESIRSRVSHRQLNLLEDFSALGSFDVILCRNVLFSFDQETQSQVLARLVAQLSPDGFLVLGWEEPISSSLEDLQLVSRDEGLFCRSADAAGFAGDDQMQNARVATA